MEPKDERLWKLARMRAQFKNSFITYLIVNTALVLFWYFGSGPKSFFWPIFPIAFWGLGVGINYYYAYIDKGDRVQKEYEKLLREQH